MLIKLSNSDEYALVDDDCILPTMSWHITPNGYARGSDKRYMHRLVLPATQDQAIDHINGNRLDNRRSNLRLVTTQQNNWNRRPNKGHKYKGTIWLANLKPNKRWRAHIRHNGKLVTIGYFKTEIEAASAYNDYALRFNGKYAKLNKITVS